jgi:heme/copper-type cytochrome/quinol oxidase subunit 1
MLRAINFITTIMKNPGMTMHKLPYSVITTSISKSDDNVINR